MPGRLSAVELFPNLNVAKTRAKTEAEAESTEADSPPSAVDAIARDAPDAPDAEARMPGDGDESFWDRRRQARRVTASVDDAKQSSVRQGLRETTPLRTTRKTRQSLVASAVTTRATRSASKRPNDDVDRNLSPIPFALAGGRDGASRSVSRAATPSSQRPAKKQKTGLRVKSS